MFGVSTNGGGQAFSLPDVCKVPAPPAPPVPTPFPNIAMLTQARGSSCSSRVRISNKKVCTVQTEISRSSGDEAGTLKGLVSSVNMDKASFREGVSKVKVEGHAVVAHLKSTGHNGSNANAPVGKQVAPSQTKVVVLG